MGLRTTGEGRRGNHNTQFLNREEGKARGGCTKKKRALVGGREGRKKRKEDDRHGGLGLLFIECKKDRAKIETKKGRGASSVPSAKERWRAVIIVRGKRHSTRKKGTEMLERT